LVSKVIQFLKNIIVFGYLENFSLVFQSRRLTSPSLTILVPFWLVIIFFMFFHLVKLLFSGFLQFEGEFFACSKELNTP